MQEATLFIAFVAGLLSFLSPCVLPLVPAYVSYMGGRAVHQVSSGGTATKQKRGIRSRFSIVIHGLAFVLGFTVVFVTLGIVTTAFVRVAGQSAAIITEIIARLGGVIIIFFGLHFMGALRNFFAWLRKNPLYFEALPARNVIAFFASVIGVFLLVDVIFNATNIDFVSYGVAVIGLGVLYVLSLISFGTTGVNSRPLLPSRSVNGQAMLPTTLLVTVSMTGLILWAFVDLIVAIPVALLFLMLLFVGKAFEQPQAYWQTAITRVETALYADTRRDIDPTSSSSLSGSFIMGVTFSAGWTPCIGPIYGAILQLGLQGEVFAAVPLLLSYSLGLGIPFLLTAGVLDGAQALLRKIQKYMGKIELFTGALLIFVGVLVAGGQLQSLSQNLTPEQTEFSINIEECGVSVAQGHIAFGDFNACMSGNLHPIALNQGITDEFTVDKTEVVYAIRIDETESITIDVSRIEGVFPATITVIAEDGEELASSDTIERVDDRYYRILADVTLPEAGRYTVVATRNDDSTEPFEFRLNVRRASDADPIEAQDTESSDADDSAITAQNDTTTSTNADTSELIVGVEEGNLAPNFVTTTLAGEAVSLEELRGQVVLINFWGTWCGPCIREMPELQQVYDNRADEGFTILA
ncbi:MAG: cytochrome c biogenesis protein CcdA, partial [Chloroflexota bacterium]